MLPALLYFALGWLALWVGISALTSWWCLLIGLGLALIGAGAIELGGAWAAGLTTKRSEP